MAATSHTYGRLLHHTQHARSRWCIVQCPPLYCNTFECTTNLMIVGLLSTALFQYVKRQDQRISKNFTSTVIFYSSWNLQGNPFFTFSLPRGGGAHPCPPISYATAFCATVSLPSILINSEKVPTTPTVNLEVAIIWVRFIWHVLHVCVWDFYSRGKRIATCSSRCSLTPHVRAMCCFLSTGKEKHVKRIKNEH